MMKAINVLRKIVLFGIGSLFSISIFAQSPEREKRIYLLDLTGSMEGRGTGVTYNILSTVKNNLSATLDGIEDMNTEVVIIPFTNKPHKEIHGYVSEKEVLHRTVEELKVLPGNTNIADAWEEGIKNLDSTKVNYMFLLTDGLHNTGPSKDVLFERLSSWQNISSGYYYYAFYVMLTPNAKEMEICNIVDSTTNMWLIESMDINASLIKTSINTKKNIYNNPLTSISFSTNNSRVKLEDLNLNLALEDNDCYEIRNIKKSLLGDLYSFEVIEKRPKLEEPLDTTFNLKISYDQETFPFVFMTPDKVELNILNQGIRKADITRLGRKHKPVEKMSFKKATYKEPFQGPFLWCRRYLEPTLNIPPYKWCVPDTACTSMNVLITFNEEAMRSHSRIRLEMKGTNDIASTHLITYNDGKTGYLNAIAEPDTVDISVRVLPGIPTTKFEGKIVAYVENIDEINGQESTSNSMSIGTWSLKYKKGIPFFLWLLWLASVALIVFLIYYLIKAVVRWISSLAQSARIHTKVAKQEARQPKKKSTNKQNKKDMNRSNNVFFHPWVGSHYSFGGIFGKRIMVLGDSHYCGTPCGKCGVNPNPKCNRLTSDVIGWCLDPKIEREGWMNTYLKFERSLVGHETTPEESRNIWDSIIYYNFLQVALHGPREAGTPEQHQASIGPFFNVLNTYQPDLLIVWGKRLWSNLPGENWIDGSEVQVDGYQVENGYYRLDNEKKVRAICVYHPSVGYSWDFWYKVIMNTL